MYIERQFASLFEICLFCSLVGAQRYYLDQVMAAALLAISSYFNLHLFLHSPPPESDLDAY